MFLLHRRYCKHRWCCKDTKEKENPAFVIVFIIIQSFFSLAIIPFLFLQILSCYQWTCLFSDEFCGDNRDPYRLSLVQSIISIFFILSVFGAQYFSNKAKNLKDAISYPEIKENCCKWP